MENSFKDALYAAIDKDGLVVVLTGAGISAESGIPTFRGPEGYWTVGSREYRPEEMATHTMFARDPEVVWQWYLYRIGICRAAEPNAGHLAVLKMEKQLQNRFLLITQNVDGLHLRAGNSVERTFQIHGNIETVRCSASCTHMTYPLPNSVQIKTKDESLSDTDRESLKCPECASWLRPHVLWFDECYNEDYYRFNSSLGAAAKADLLLTVGTSGATNLPMQVGMIVAQRGGVIVDVNPDSNPFSAIAEQSGGFFRQGPAGDILPEIVDVLS
ncbi:MAG: RNA polymerase subunit sigma [Deltaproteobacteria bacterium]|nr:RNA polymerase subunit sigma [Deltaproteobacteria bacterium]